MPLIPLIWLGGGLLSIGAVKDLVREFGDTGDRIAPGLVVAGGIVVSLAGLYVIRTTSK